MTGACSVDHYHPFSTFPVFDQALEAMTRQIEAQMPGEPVREMAWRVCFPSIGNGTSTDHALGTEVQRVAAAYAAAVVVAETSAENARLRGIFAGLRKVWFGGVDLDLDAISQATLSAIIDAETGRG